MTSAAGPTDEEKRVYADSWKSTLHDWADEDSYDLKGDGCGLIISNTFDDPDSAGQFGDSYKNITRHGGKEDRRRVRALLKHLNIKILGDHENVKSEVRYSLYMQILFDFVLQKVPQ